ncbi:MAG: hypothetical protein KGK08_05300 [Acidobacteriota bacterium]|nr:hypothetical protein [Acidobacteriota bacterium]
MSKLTQALGALLILIAVFSFMATGHTHPTALIPGIFGLLFVLFGAKASSPEAKTRKLWMHIAVTLGLLGFLSTLPAVVDLIRMLRGVAFPHPIAVEEKASLSILCGIYVVLCVRSFIAARRSGKLESA